jgi:DNA-binding phage protein
MKKNKMDYPTFENFMFKQYSPDELKQLRSSIIDEFNESGEISFEDLFKALKELMRLEGMSKIARETNLSR